MKKARRYLIALFSGLIMACLAGRAGLNPALPLSARFTALSNGCFLAAVLLLGLGLLLLAANDGFFHIFGYAGYVLLMRFKPVKGERKPHDSFYDYRARKQGKSAPFAYLIVVGGGFLILAIVFDLLYNGSLTL